MSDVTRTRVSPITAEPKAPMTEIHVPVDVVKSEFKDITAPVWRASLVSHPEVVWARYADAMGVEEMRATFGDHWPPGTARQGEEVYGWRDANLNPVPFDTKGHPAAWLSLFRDPLDPSCAYMSRGVWPDQHGRGLGRLMRQFAEDWCRERGAETLDIFVSASNWRHLAQVVRDPYWVLDAVTFGDDPQFGFHHDVCADAEARVEYACGCAVCPAHEHPKTGG